MFTYYMFFFFSDTRNGYFLTAAAIFRGKVSAKVVETQMKLMQERDSPHFAYWFVFLFLFYFFCLFIYHSTQKKISKNSIRIFKDFYL
jgi:hypothetical protein